MNFLVGGTDEDERMFLALQRPEIFGFGEEWVRERPRGLMGSRHDFPSS